MRTFILAILFLLGPVPSKANPDIAGFVDGRTSVFNSKGHRKAGGAEISFRYPSSWRIAEGDRPHVVKKISARDGSGAICMLIIIADKQIHASDMTAALEPSEMRAIIPPSSSFIRGNKISIDGQDGGELIYSTSGVVGSQVVYSHSVMYFSGYEGIMFQFLCSVSSIDPDVNLAVSFIKYEQIFQLMRNSIVINDKWKRNMENASAPSLRINWLEITLGFTIGWGVGLTPALVARYFIYREPMSRKSANWIAGSGSVFFALLFMVLSAAAGEKPNPAPWVVVFFVARWIMIRGSKTGPDRLPAG